MSELNDRRRDVVKDASSCSKGAARSSACGFSRRGAILDPLGCRSDVDASGIRVRQGIKDYSTADRPAALRQGEFVVGSDIMMEMFERRASAVAYDRSSPALGCGAASLRSQESSPERPITPRCTATKLCRARRSLRQQREALGGQQDADDHDPDERRGGRAARPASRESADGTSSRPAGGRPSENPKSGASAAAPGPQRAHASQDSDSRARTRRRENLRHGVSFLVSRSSLSRS